MKTLGTTTTYDGTEHAYLRGHKVRIVADSPRNFKITTLDDLALAELWARRPA